MDSHNLKPEGSPLVVYKYVNSAEKINEIDRTNHIILSLN